MQIAKNGLGYANPNPSVGAVIVYKNKIIGEGFTAPYGGNHAEVNAITSVKQKALLKEATLYVTLEPCVHFGKTPPCTDLIIKHKIKNVVIGCIDTNNLVAGKGVARLKKANINVLVGVLENQCKEHHKRFFTFQNKKRPYIILKWAQTKNGFIAPLKKSMKAPVWISNKYAQQLVHKYRAKEQAILVGTNTVILDNPKLNVRSWKGNNPTRIVIDKNLRIPKNANVFDNSVKTIVITENKKQEKENIIFEKINFSKNIAHQICAILHKNNILSVIIEGGTQTLQTFIDENLWDETKIFIGNIEFEKGIKAPKFTSKNISEKKVQNNVLKIYAND